MYILPIILQILFLKVKKLFHKLSRNRTGLSLKNAISRDRSNSLTKNKTSLNPKKKSLRKKKLNWKILINRCMFTCPVLNPE